jgi:NAD(P)-dependent dehydrogenase (short-subunit alcohol dehydrogenase family)
MDTNLKGKKAVVSGSTLGIGFATAAILAKLGACVVVNGRKQASVDDAIARIRKEHPAAELVGYAGDLATIEGVQDLALKHPDVDIVVNNLGIFEAKAFEDVTDDEWKMYFDVNVLSGVRLSRAYLPYMRKQNWGRIVFVSSEAALMIPTEMPHYGMTKTAQLAVARGLAELVAGTNITVNSVLPGPTQTEGVDAFLAKLAKANGLSHEEMATKFMAEHRPSSIIKRFLTPTEVANSIAYLVTPAASGTTGSTIRVEGGSVRSTV